MDRGGRQNGRLGKLVGRTAVGGWERDDGGSVVAKDDKLGRVWMDMGTV